MSVCNGQVTFCSLLYIFTNNIYVNVKNSGAEEKGQSKIQGSHGYLS